MDHKEVIRDFLLREVLHSARTEPLLDEDPLIESGIIDSMGVMTLLGFLEERFSLQVRSEDLVPENFSSISTIAALVERSLGK